MAEENTKPTNADIESFCGSTIVDRKASMETVKKAIPPNGTYNINSPNWPSLQLVNGTAEVTCKKGSSMCTIATSANLQQQIADTLKASNIPITQDVANFIGDKKGLMKFGMNGNTFAPAVLTTMLGGVCITGNDTPGITAALKKAKPGDQFIYARAKGGHATTFVGLKGSEACFLSSQKRTNGMGEACVAIDKLKSLSLCRLPMNGQTLMTHIKTLMGKKEEAPEPKDQGFLAKAASIVKSSVNWVKEKLGLISSQASANKVKQSDVNWSNDFPNCPTADQQTPAPTTPQETDVSV